MANLGGNLGGGPVGGAVGGVSGGGSGGGRNPRDELRQRAAAVAEGLGAPAAARANPFAQVLALPAAGDPAFAGIVAGIGSGGRGSEADPFGRGESRNWKFRHNSREARSLLT